MENIEKDKFAHLRRPCISPPESCVSMHLSCKRVRSGTKLLRCCGVGALVKFSSPRSIWSQAQQAAKLMAERLVALRGGCKGGCEVRLRPPKSLKWQREGLNLRP